jgi:arylsulfatase
MLDLLDELGIADDTIVMYSTDNGVHFNTWPDAGITPFRSEKNTNWEGAFRVPAFFRWPGHFPAGTVLNGIVSHQDVLPTFLAAAGEPEIVDKAKAGHTIGDRTYRVHLDGYNMLPYFSGDTDESPRREFFYINDDGQLMALRYDDWKAVFLEQRASGLRVWMEPFVELRIPLIFNLRQDPFERASTDSNTYYDWLIDHAFMLVPAQAIVANVAQTLIDYPPRQKPAAFNLDTVLARIEDAMGGGQH